MRGEGGGLGSRGIQAHTWEERFSLTRGRDQTRTTHHQFLGVTEEN